VKTVSKTIERMRDEARRQNQAGLVSAALFRYAKELDVALSEEASLVKMLRLEFTTRRRLRLIQRLFAFAVFAIGVGYFANYQSRRLAGFVTCAPGHFDELIGGYAVCSTNEPWPTVSVVPLEK